MPSTFLNVKALSPGAERIIFANVSTFKPTWLYFHKMGIMKREDVLMNDCQSRKHEMKNEYLTSDRYIDRTRNIRRLLIWIRRKKARKDEKLWIKQIVEANINESGWKMCVCQQLNLILNQQATRGTHPSLLIEFLKSGKQKELIDRAPRLFIIEWFKH